MNEKRAVFIIATLAFLVLLFYGLFGLSLHLPLLFHLIFAAIMALLWGYSYREVEKMLLDGFARASNVLLILMLIGGLIGIWISGGTIPTIIYWGLQFIDPTLFYLIAFLAGVVTSIAMGTGIGALSTVGLAFFSIGAGLGLPLPLAAGAVVSGCYFGDRFSPVSSITIFTASTTESNLNTVLKKMLITTIIPFVVAGLFYYYMGGGSEGSSEALAQGQELMALLKENYNVSMATLLPPLFIIVLALFRIPTMANLSLGLIFSIVLFLIINPREGFVLIESIYSGPLNMATENELLVNIFSRGGIVSMLDLIALIMIAGALSGVFEKMGIFKIILKRLIARAKSEESLLFLAGISSIFVAMVGCNQLLAVLLPGRAFSPHFSSAESKAKLARVLTDSGLIASPLIPWNINALLVVGVLGVSTIEYLPYAVFNWVMILSSMGYLGIITIKNLKFGKGNGNVMSNTSN